MSYGRARYFFCDTFGGADPDPKNKDYPIHSARMGVDLESIAMMYMTWESGCPKSYVIIDQAGQSKNWAMDTGNKIYVAWRDYCEAKLC